MVIPPTRRANQLANGGLGRNSGSRRTSTNNPEKWLFWFASSPAFFPQIKRQYRGAASVRQMSPSSVNHVVEVFMQIGRDLTDLGLGPYKCPTSLTSGIHSVILVRTITKSINHLLYTQSHLTKKQHIYVLNAARCEAGGGLPCSSAQHTCTGPVDVFGFSYSAQQAKGKPIGYSGHTWALDVLVYRLMHLAGFVNVCATDPLISL